MFRGPCGKIMNCILYDLVKKEIVEFKGLKFYSIYWNFDPNARFDEKEVHEAYMKYIEKSIHQDKKPTEPKEAEAAVRKYPLRQQNPPNKPDSNKDENKKGLQFLIYFTILNIVKIILINFRFRYYA